MVRRNGVYYLTQELIEDVNVDFEVVIWIMLASDEV